ncbi:MAG: hypothetical protein V4568_13690, partial [Pseudomonadota bacterium]
GALIQEYNRPSLEIQRPLVRVPSSVASTATRSTTAIDTSVITTVIPPADGTKVEPKGICANSGLRYQARKAAAVLFSKKPKTELKKYLPGEKAAFAKQFEGQRLSSKDLKVLTEQDRISAGWEPIGQRKDGSVLFRVDGGGEVKGAILPAPLVKNQFTVGQKVAKGFKVGDGMQDEQSLTAQIGEKTDKKKGKTL